MTRRCTQRQFLLRPSPLANQIFRYCVAYAAEKAEVVIHAICTLSNHHHVVLTDPKGNLPVFAEWFHKYTAKCLNVSLGRWENLWSSHPYSAVRLESIDDMLDKILYTMLNPVSACLTPTAEQWPGVISLPDDYLKGPVVVERPAVYFSKKGKMPATITLNIVPPKCMEEATTEEFVEMLSEELKLRQADICRQHRLANRQFLGREAVLNQDPFSSPQSFAPRRTLNPRIGAKDKWRRIEAIGRLQTFLVEYRDALKKWKQGHYDVVFPAGTYWMVRHANAVSAAPN